MYKHFWKDGLAADVDHVGFIFLKDCFYLCLFEFCFYKSVCHCEQGWLWLSWRSSLEIKVHLPSHPLQWTVGQTWAKSTSLCTSRFVVYPWSSHCSIDTETLVTSEQQPQSYLEKWSTNYERKHVHNFYSSVSRRKYKVHFKPMVWMLLMH